MNFWKKVVMKIPRKIKESIEDSMVYFILADETSVILM